MRQKTKKTGIRMQKIFLNDVRSFVNDVRVTPTKIQIFFLLMNVIEIFVEQKTNSDDANA